jgi:CheY-like chemotaxis protein
MDDIKIMVIEDSPETRNTLKEIFEMSFSGGDVPCEVLINSSGEEALARLESGVIPNLIILDIHLPGISGAEVLVKLKNNEKWKKIPIFPYSSLWNEKTDLPFNEHLQIVKDWYEAARHSEKVGVGLVTQVTPKYQGQESTSIIHPQLVVFVASVLIQQGFELSPSFEMMVKSARRVLSDKNL